MFTSLRPENWLTLQSKLVLRINLKLGNGETQVGSVELNMDDTVEAVEERIKVSCRDVPALKREMCGSSSTTWLAA